jgi:uncharacterized protein with HEPN domain
MDKKSSLELIAFILLSIELIEERFAFIKTRDDFIEDHAGLEKLDAISMRLQSIGEAIKNLLKRDADILLTKNEKSYWSDIVRFREIISHHYIDIDSEIVFDICTDDLLELKEIIQKIYTQLQDT